MKGNFKIRKLNENDRIAYKKLMRYAFEPAKNNYEDLKWPAEKTPMDWFYGAFAEETLVAGVGYFIFDIRMRSQDFKVYGITMVGSKPEFRNRGIIRELMIKIFKDMNENNIPISILYPFKHSFYERLGYKQVDESIFYEFKISDILYKETDYSMKEVERINDDIRSVYDRVILNFDYITKRPEFLWSYLYKDNYKFICYHRNLPVGYAIIKFPKTDPWLKHPDKTILVLEAFWLDHIAKQTIFNFLWSHRDQRKYIAVSLPKSENIIDLLKAPRIKTRYVGDLSQLRIIDVKAVLENLRYTLQDFTIRFQILDELCPWNNGFFTLSSEDRDITVTFSESLEVPVDVKIDIRYLAQMLAGFRTVKDLSDFGFISVDNEKIEILQNLFPLTNNYLHDFF